MNEISLSKLKENTYFRYAAPLIKANEGKVFRIDHHGSSHGAKGHTYCMGVNHSFGGWVNSALQVIPVTVDFQVTDITMPTTFEEIPPGTVFKYQNVLWVKMPSGKTAFALHAYSTSTKAFRHTFFLPGTEVEVIDPFTQDRDGEPLPKCSECQLIAADCECSIDYQS